MLSTFQIITHPTKDCKEKDESSSNAISLLRSTNEVNIDNDFTIKKPGSLSRKCHNHRQQTNPRHREEENTQYLQPHHNKITFNPYKPSVLFMGHWQTVQTQIRHRIMRCLIWIFTVCLQNVLFKFWKK